MPNEIKIRWEGSAPGLADKRLSLSAFGTPLTSFLAALRRIAASMVGDAFEERSVGRLPDIARQLDIEIKEVVKGSAGFSGVITLNPPIGVTPSLLFSDLPERAAKELFESIDSERRGMPRNSAVRKYLQSLPPGITKQTYSLYNDETIIKEVVFAETELLALPKSLPFLCRYVGRIVGLGFEPGKTEVRIQSDSHNLRLSATSEQVEHALHLRTVDVEVTAVSSEAGQRLLIIRDRTIPLEIPTRDVAIYEKWNELLTRLAR